MDVGKRGRGADIEISSCVEKIYINMARVAYHGPKYKCQKSDLLFTCRFFVCEFSHHGWGGVSGGRSLSDNTKTDLHSERTVPDVQQMEAVDRVW